MKENKIWVRIQHVCGQADVYKILIGKSGNTLLGKPTSKGVNNITMDHNWM
jgi:hypothetical protein